MQQAIYSNISKNITIGTTNKTATPVSRRIGLGQRIAQKWDMLGVLALMVSSGMYGIYAIAHSL